MKPATKAMAQTTIIDTKRRHYDDVLTIRASERKLEPQITIRFAEKAPKFVAGGKNIVVYKK